MSIQRDVTPTRLTGSRRGRRQAWFAAPASAILAALALSGPAAAATPTPTSATSYVPAQDQGATTQGIIMRDGGICNPRWGC